MAVNKSGFALDMLVVGLGQAGGKLAGEFHRRGYRVLALNTAAADLRALGASGAASGVTAGGGPSVPADYRLNIGLEGYDGAGCDPSFGRSCVAAHADVIRRTVLERSQGADMIVLTAGLGGGTGSSLRALIDVLQEQPLPMIALVTLPMRGENAIVKVNAVRALNELTSAGLRNLILVDNARADELVRDASMSEYYTKVNQAIVDPLDQLNQLNSRDDLQSLRSFDGEELRKLLLAGGVLNYGSMVVGQLNLQELNEAVHHCLRAGELMPPGFEPNNISYLALVIAASVPTLARVPMSVIDNFHQHWKTATNGAAVEVGIYSTQDPTAPTKLWLLAISQSLPLEVQELVLEASREATTVRDKLKKSIVGIDISGLEGMDILPNFARRSPLSVAPPAVPSFERGESLEGMLMSAAGSIRPAEALTANGHGEANTGASAKSATGSTKPPPANYASSASANMQPANMQAPGPSVAEVPMKKSSSAPMASAKARRPSGSRAALSQQEVDMSIEEAIESASIAPGAPMPPPLPLGAKNLPDPGLYEQLAEDFRAAATEEMRHEIAERLENDRFSEHAVVRYYVVKAMSQLDRRLFEMSLIAATEDENESVRALASIALRN